MQPNIVTLNGSCQNFYNVPDNRAKSEDLFPKRVYCSTIVAAIHPALSEKSNITGNDPV